MKKQHTLNGEPLVGLHLAANKGQVALVIKAKAYQCEELVRLFTAICEGRLIESRVERMLGDV